MMASAASTASTETLMDSCCNERPKLAGRRPEAFFSLGLRSFPIKCPLAKNSIVCRSFWVEVEPDLLSTNHNSGSFNDQATASDAIDATDAADAAGEPNHHVLDHILLPPAHKWYFMWSFHSPEGKNKSDRAEPRRDDLDVASKFPTQPCGSVRDPYISFCPWLLWAKDHPRYPFISGLGLFVVVFVVVVFVLTVATVRRKRRKGRKKTGTHTAPASVFSVVLAPSRSLTFIYAFSKRLNASRLNQLIVAGWQGVWLGSVILCLARAAGAATAAAGRLSRVSFVLSSKASASDTSRVARRLAKSHSLGSKSCGLSSYETHKAI